MLLVTALPDGWMAQVALVLASTALLGAATLLLATQRRSAAVVAVLVATLAAVTAFGIHQRWPGW